MVPLALGSQTNGSMIRPAAFCGVFGVKPSHGLISRGGALTLSRTLDHVGAFARSIDDLALVLDVLVGQDSADADSRPYASPKFRVSAAEPPPIPPSFALVRTPMWEKADADARDALEDLAKELGAREVDPGRLSRCLERIARDHQAVEMAHNLGDFVDNGGEASKTFRELIAEGRKVTATEYLAAIRDARRYADGMASIFEQLADAVITLSARGVAPLGIEATGDPVFCTLWTLTGFPSLNVPLRRTRMVFRSVYSWLGRLGVMNGYCALRALLSSNSPRQNDVARSYARRYRRSSVSDVWDGCFR